MQLSNVAIIISSVVSTTTAISTQDGLGASLQSRDSPARKGGFGARCESGNECQSDICLVGFCVGPDAAAAAARPDITTALVPLILAAVGGPVFATSWPEHLDSEQVTPRAES
ncbi:hypothetical protein PspLS_09266 [Pyricularia sp. CBS 133598]|nr:hypothetical protein PspLS_09266 [Pyricularia sp. CBS 133598]